MPENEKTQHFIPAQGNQVALRIVDYEGEGLIIQWANPNFKNTYVNCDGANIDMYRYLKGKFPGTSNAAGARITIVSDEHGSPLELAIQGDEPVKLKERKE